MDFRLLGPLEVAQNGRELELTGAKQRAVLAILLLHANEVVASDRLIEELWGEEPPATAAKSLQVHVSRLRRSLTNGAAGGAKSRVVTRAGGYQIQVERDELDLARFERLIEQGREALADGAPERAARLLRDALRLWRGPPLVDFAYETFAQPEIARLEELHLTGLEARIEADLALGHASRLIGELEALASRYPFRERLWAQLMLALYRAGRQAEALAAYQAARRALVDELGIEPGAELKEMERAILSQDPGLDRPAGGQAGFAEPAARRPRRLALAGAALLFVAVALAVVLVAARDDGDAAAPLTADSQGVAIIDPASNEVTEALATGARPGPLAFDPGSGSLWVANLDDETVTHIDARRARVGRTIAIGDPPGGSLSGGSRPGPRVGGLAAGAGAVWVASANQSDPFVSLWKIDPRFDTHRRVARLPSSQLSTVDVALGRDEVWVAPAWGPLRRADPRTGSPRGPGIDPGHTPTAIATTDDAVWIANGDAGTVTRVDAASGLTTPIPVGNGPAGIAVGGGRVWVAVGLDDSLVELDSEAGSVRRTIPVGRGPAGVAVGAGGVWVANSRDGTVSRIDPGTGEVVATVPVGPSPVDVEVADGRVWVSIRPRTLHQAPTEGGVLRVEVPTGPRFVDPALGWGALEWMVGYATGAKLLNYPDDPSRAGSRLVPEVAEALPARSADGRRYTFRIREGFRFSPPSGEPVTARTFKDTIERSLDPATEGPAGDFLRDVVGARAFTAGKAESVTGITARGRTLTIRLTRPAGDFLARLALPFFAAVPSDAPIDPEGVRELPTAGPYYLASNEPGEGLVLARNPNYGGSRPHRLREIRLAVGVGPERAVANVEAGTADFATEIGGTRDADRLARRYGPRSDAAKAGRQRYFVSPRLGVEHIVLNTTRGPFSSVRMRKAVNYAIDRRALARPGGLNSGGRAIPTDQYLPPGLPGFDDVRIYPSSPNVAKARRLARGGPRTAVLYAFDNGVAPRLAQIVKANMRAIGIDVQVHLFPVLELFERIGSRGEPYDMAMMGWYADYADPANFLFLLDGRTRMEGCALCVANYAHFDDPEITRRLAAAARLSGPERYLAYGRLERDMAREAAPWAAFGNEAIHDFFSARIGCQAYHPLYGMDLAALCVRE